MIQRAWFWISASEGICPWLVQFGEDSKGMGAHVLIGVVMRGTRCHKSLQLSHQSAEAVCIVEEILERLRRIGIGGWLVLGHFLDGLLYGHPIAPTGWR